MMQICKKNNHTLIAITHYPPTKEVLTNTSSKKKRFQSMYATNLDYLLDKSFVQKWICGHIHKNFDFISMKGCHIVGNQKGKPKDKIIDYKKNFLIEI
jgi:Icc-related predicted phosphoesterase